MNFSQLRTFVTVVDKGSFSEAARTLGISQPAVTMQMQALEADIGVTLLDRRYRGVDLTEAGSALVLHARSLLDGVEEARHEIASLSGKVTGRLAISASTTPGDYIVPRVLGGFLTKYPEVRVALAVNDSEQVIRCVEEGTADVGLSGIADNSAKALFEEVARDEIVAICPPDGPLASAKHVTFAELADVDWVARELGSGTGRVAEHTLLAHGVDPQELRMLARLGTGEAVVCAVEGGLGVAMVSRFVAEKALALGTVAEMRVEGMPVQRPLFAVLPKGTPTSAATAFVEHVSEYGSRNSAR
jgi:DNA-binding transcriptional LysR family regulator